MELQKDLTALGVKVMRKIAALDAERKYLRKELADKVCRLENTEKELELAKASLDFERDDEFENGREDGSEIGGMDIVEEDNVGE